MNTQAIWLPSAATLAMTVATSYGIAWAGPELLGGETVLFWWSILVPGVFYVAPVVYVVKRRAKTDTQVLRPSLEALAMSVAGVAGLTPALHMAWPGLVYGEDQLWGLLMLCAFHPPPVPLVHPVALVLDSALSTSLYFLFVRSQDPPEAGSLASVVCLVGLPVFNLAVLLAVWALCCLSDWHGGIGLVFFFILIGAERVAVPLAIFVLLWRRARMRT